MLGEERKLLLTAIREGKRSVSTILFLFFVSKMQNLREKMINTHGYQQSLKIKSNILLVKRQLNDTKFTVYFLAMSEVAGVDGSVDGRYWSKAEDYWC